MRITIVQGAFLPVPPLLGGAVEKVWFALGKEFARAGHLVTHISRRYDGLDRTEHLEGVKHVRVSGFDTPASLLLLKFRDLIYSIRVRAILPDADILVTNTFWLPVLVRNGRCGKIYVHVARYPKGQMRLYSHADRLHTVSHAVAQAIEQEAPDLASRVRVIPYPLTILGNRKDWLESGVQKQKHILFVGRIHPEKGVDLLIKAFATLGRDRLEEWRLVVVGPAETRFGGGGGRYLSCLHDLANSVADRVEWIGAVFDADRLAKIYREAALFVYPSLADRGETFGLAPLEAMAHGCVPIVSNLPCFREYIVKGITGLVFDHHTQKPEEALARELTALMADEGRLKLMSQAAVHKSMEYGIEEIAKLHMADFDMLVRG